MRWRCSAYALHMSWRCSAYALELQRICVAYALELQLICVEVCQKHNFSRGRGSPTRGSACCYCISKCCRSSNLLSTLTVSIFKFLIFSGLFCAPVWKLDLKMCPGGYQNMSDFFSKFFIISECHRFIHSSIFSSIGWELMSRDKIIIRGGKSDFCPPLFCMAVYRIFKSSGFS